MSEYNDRATFRAQVEQELCHLSKRVYLLAQFPNRSEFEAEEVCFPNTGMWIPNWREDRPDLSGRIIPTCVWFEFSDGVYTYDTLEYAIWVQPETPSVILEPRTIS
jgi:hypothetical protein